MSSTELEAPNGKSMESEVKAVMSGDSFGGFKIEGISIAGQVFNSKAYYQSQSIDGHYWHWAIAV